MPIPQGLSYANKTRWGLPDNPSPTGFRCVTLFIPDDDYYQEQVIGFLFKLSQQNRYDRDEAHTARIVAATWQSATFETLSRWGESCESPAPEPTSQERIRYIHSLVELESEEEMPILRIETIDGRPYLEEDCGCGQRNYYALSGVSVNPETGAISSALDSPPDYVEDVPLTQEQIDDCYANAVADTVVDALVDYTGAVFDFAVLGAGVFFPVTTTAIIGAVEIQQGIAAFLNGNLQLDFSDVGYTAQEVQEAFDTTDFRDFIKARIGDDQRLSRFVLELVSIRLLNNGGLNFPTPIYPVFAAWVKMCDMAQLNSQLQIAATECATGNSVRTPGQGWEIDLTLYDDEGDLPFIFNDNGSGQLGTLVAGQGIKPTLVSQWQVWVSWAISAGMPSGVGIEEVGYRLGAGGMGGNPFLRSICNYDSTGCSGSATNVSGQSETNVDSASVVTDGAGIYFNALTDDSMTFDRLRIKFDQPVSMPLGWTPYEFV